MVDINKAQQCKLVLDMVILDAEGKPLVVGEQYEMYAPTAVGAHVQVGLVFKDPEYKFTYLGVIDMGTIPYIASKDVTYDESVLPAAVFKGSLEIAKLYGGAYPVCPCQVASKAIRKATD